MRKATIRDIQEQPEGAEVNPSRLSEADLTSLKAQRRIIRDQTILISMLTACYNRFMVGIQQNYDVPADVRINIETGELSVVQETEEDNV